MQVLEKSWYSDRNIEWGVSSAVENTCMSLDDNGSRRGAVESVEAQVRQTAAVLGEVIEMLNASGKLSDDEVLTLLNKFRPYGNPYRKAG